MLHGTVNAGIVINFLIMLKKCPCISNRMAAAPSEYKPGDYLECGFDQAYSKVLVIFEDNVLIKDGFGQGTVVSMVDWHLIIGENKSNVRKIAFFEEPKKLKGILKTPSIDSIYEGNGYNGGNGNCVSDISRQTSIRRIRSQGSIDSQGSIGSRSVKRSVSIDNVLQIRTIEPADPRPIPITKAKAKLPWYYNLILCGLFDD